MSSHAPLELASLIDKVSRSHQRSKQRAETAEKPVRKIRLAEPVEAEMDKKIDEEIFTFPFLYVFVVIDNMRVIPMTNHFI